MLRIISRSVGVARRTLVAWIRGDGVRPGCAAGGQALQQICSDTRGVSAIEFAIIAPVFLTICVGMLKFGIAINNYMLLNNGAAQGAMTMALGRGTATPYTTMVTAIDNAASSLTPSSITTTVKINGTACTSDSTCSSALVAGATVTVITATPCDLTIMGVNYKSSCTVHGQSAMMVQ